MTESAEAPTIEPNAETEGGASPLSLSLLAKQEFGHNFHGEVKEAEPEADNTEEAETDENAEAAPAEEADGAEEVDAAEADVDESEARPIASLPELIDHQEWDPEWVESLEVPVKVDGRPATATIGDLKASYQMREMAEQYLEEARSAKKTQSKQFSEKAEALEGQFAVAAKLIESAEGLLNAETESADLQALRESDPAEYAAKVADLSQKRKAIEDMKREAVESYQRAAIESGETQEAIEKRLLAEQEALLEKHPDWRDEARAQEDKAKLRRYLIVQGFTEQDVDAASDHRLVLMAHKARLYDEGQTKVAAAKKKVAKVPKVMKPGAPKPQEQISREKLDKARTRLRSARGMDAQLAAGVELLRAKRGG